MRIPHRVFQRSDVKEVATQASKAIVPAATKVADEAWSVPSNLERWKTSGYSQRWVEARDYRWNHEDWLNLLRDLERSDFWPLDPNEVGAVLEALKT